MVMVYLPGAISAFKVSLTALFQANALAKLVAVGTEDVLPKAVAHHDAQGDVVYLLVRF